MKTLNEIRKLMCEDKVYEGHPDTQAYSLHNYLDEPEVAEALADPDVRYGSGYVLGDGPYMMPGGRIIAFETR